MCRKDYGAYIGVVSHRHASLGARDARLRCLAFALLDLASDETQDVPNSGISRFSYASLGVMAVSVTVQLGVLSGSKTPYTCASGTKC